MFYLSATEKMAFEGLILREQMIRKQFVEPLESDLQLFYREVERRLALPENSLGQLYTLDTQTWTVKEVKNDLETPTEDTSA